jgi:hypothetical protein
MIDYFQSSLLRTFCDGIFSQDPVSERNKQFRLILINKFILGSYGGRRFSCENCGD